MGGQSLKPRASNLPAELTSFVGRRPELREVKRLLATTRLLTLTGSGGLGQTAYEAAFEHGRAMTISEGVAFAVEDKQPPKAAPATKPGSHAVLTGRQFDVARLVADGFSNKQIADRLFLSERTIETHITNILNKLGLSSRTQIIRWMTDLSPPGLAPQE
jgi:DNA-binding NarL/FixJ family response regulator